MTVARRPKPGQMGGKLIRRVIAQLRAQNLTLPITSHILLATSAGSDSIALTTLIAKYGHRVGAKISVLHINHHWRGRASDLDAELVAKLARKFGVEFILRDVSPPKTGDGESWEAVARDQRKKIYREEAAARKAIVMTAHHGDDLAETVLWRILTGNSSTHAGGIRFQDGPEIRPLLSTRKKELQEFLQEEGQAWREDRTNRDPRFLRARLRTRVFPELEQVFPRFVEHLIALGLSIQNADSAGKLASAQIQQHLESLMGASGVAARRPHLEWLKSQVTQSPDWRGELHLPGGWRLTKAGAERWILERSPEKTSHRSESRLPRS